MKLKGLGTVLSNRFKDHQTLKINTKLIALVKVITLSRNFLFVPKKCYISDAYAGLATYRFINEDTNIASQLTLGYFILFDKGFNVQNFFLQYK